MPHLVLRLMTVVLLVVAGWLPVPVLAASSDACAAPANPIVAENCQAGTGEWLIENYTDTIAGYASATSVASSDTLDFLVDTDAPQFDLSIYRSGYYGGKGGRLMLSARGLTGHKQPACHTDLSTGLLSCSNWTPSYSLTVPTDWVSGIYLAKLVRSDGGENFIIFVVRDDKRKSDLLFQQSVTTYQAYNPYGGKSVYSSIKSNSCLTVADAPRAVKVSLDRPINKWPYAQNGYIYTDYPWVHWLEAQGYDVSYVTSLDTHESGKPGHVNKLLGHRAFLSIGHDEYWSREMRAAVTAARDSGVNLGFFSSNVSYWKIRFESDPWTGKPDRVMVVYKTTESGVADPTGDPTTTWRDPQGANDPENALIGIMYFGDNDLDYFPLRVSAEQAQDRLYRHTDLQNMSAQTYADIGRHLVGWEWDAVVNNGRTPAGLEVLAESPTHGAVLIDAGRVYTLTTGTANVARYVADSGAIVFAAGTNQWGWGLAIFEPNPYLQQITYNLFADMGAVPMTPASTLVLDSAQLHTGTVSYAADGQSTIIVTTRAMLAIMGFQGDYPLGEPTSVVFHAIAKGSLPTISGVGVISAIDSASINWVTDVPTQGHVYVNLMSGDINWGLAESPGHRMPIQDKWIGEFLTTSHKFVVDSLDPDRMYYAQIVATDANGLTTISPEISFSTAGGSLGQKAYSLFGDVYRSMSCEMRARLPLLAGLSLGAVGVVVLMVVPSVVNRRRRKNLNEHLAASDTVDV